MAPPPVPIDAELLLAQTGWVRALARALVGDAARADDVAQEALLAALARPPHGARSEPVLRAWLARVVRNLAGLATRGDARRAGRERAAARADRAPAADEIVARADGHRRVVEAVMELDEPVRTAVLLRYFDGLDHRAIAARTRTTPAAARKRVSRGLVELRERLDRESHGDRASWMSALAPLAALPTGGTIMGIKTLAGASAALVALAAIGLWATREPSASVAPIDGASANDAQLVAASADVEEPAREEVAADAAREPVATEPSPVPGAARSDRASLVVEAIWADGTPAEGQRVRTLSWEAPDPYDSERHAFTDASGRARFDDLHPGRTSVGRHGGGGCSAQLVAAEEHVARLSIPVGTTIDGLVVDERGDVVAGAEVWLSGFGNTTDGHVVAGTDASGRFRLRDVERGRYLAAHAPGHAPSGAYDVPTLVGETIELELRLRGPGGALEGTVLDPTGAPAAGARIQVSYGHQSLVDPDGRTLAAPPPRRVLADAAGRFVVRGVSPGHAALAIVHAGAAPHTESLAIEAGRTEVVAVALGAEAIVAGTVRDDEGAPVSDVDVLAGEYAGFTAAGTRTASDGTFVLKGLRPGAVDVRASGRERGGARATLLVAAGTTTRWDPVLVRGDSVGGVLVDEAGKPLGGWRVAAVKPDQIGLWHRETRSADDGTFLLESLPDGELLIEAREPGSFPGDPTLLVELERGRRDVRLVVPRDALLSAHVVGSAVAADGARLEGLALVLWSALSGSGQETAPDALGRFEIGPLRPGRYRLAARADGCVEHEGAWFELARDETLDLGVVVLHPGGFVRATVRAPDGVSAENVQCRLLDERGNSPAWFDVERNVAQSPPVAPGTYLLLADGGRFAAIPCTVEIAARATTELELELVPCATRVLVLELPPGWSGPLLLRVRVRDAADRIVWATGTKFDLASEPLRFWATGLFAGTYSVIAESDEGLSATGTFTIDDVAAPRSESRFALR